MPKLLRRSANGRCLTLGETLREPFSHCHSPRCPCRARGRLRPRQRSEVIRGAVAEMLSQLDGNSRRDAEVADFATAIASIKPMGISAWRGLP